MICNQRTGMRRHVNLPIFIPELACPRRCIFCNQGRITGQTHIPAPVEVEGRISQYLATAPADADIEIAFFGGTFTALPLAAQQEYLASARHFIASGRVSSIRISTRPDFISESILDMLKMYSVATVELGIQSFSDAVLSASQRGYDRARAEEACRMVKNAGMALGVQLMIGLPVDSREQCLESCSLSAANGADMARIYPVLVLAGTELASMMEDGRYLPLDLEEAVESSADMLLALENDGIQVIRIGLQSSQDLIPGQSVIAGPYHPAFGELVEQCLYYRLACAEIESHGRSGKRSDCIHLEVPRGQLSKLIGQRRAGIKRLKNEYRLHELTVSEAAERSLTRRVVLKTDV